VGFKKEHLPEFMESFPIDFIFIDRYLKDVNGTYLKVYLAAYSQSYKSSSFHRIDNDRDLADFLSLSLDDVSSAWDYWEEKGLVRRDPDDQSITFVNLKSMYLGDLMEKAPQGDFGVETEDSSAYHSCTPNDLASAHQIPEIKKMFSSIQKIIPRDLTPNEQLEILEWIINHNLEPPLITEAYTYGVEKRGTSSFQYISRIILNWIDDGISSLEDLRSHEHTLDDHFTFYRRVLKAIGVYNREATEKEKELMDLWMDEFHYSIDLVLKACEETVKISNPNIKYIHGILKKWKEKNVASVEDLKDLPSSPPRPQGSSDHSRHKTKFHLSQSRGDRYSAKELEKIILERQKKK